MHLAPGFTHFLITVLLLMLETPLFAANKPILVHYMPWYEAKPFSGNWGWHWTMNHYNPDTTNSLGRRDIASWFYPTIGPYDSADPAVLEYHVLLMKLSGVDGVIADWYGQEDYLDYGIINQRTLALRDYTRRAGLKFALCFEDRTVQAKVNGGYISSNNAVANAQQTMRYVQTNYFNSANYLQLSNHPVLLNFGPIYFKNNSQWVSIFSVLAASNQPAFFTEDVRLPAGTGAFPWPPMSLANGGILSSGALENYLGNFQNAAASWPAFVGGSFPRFKDIYQQAGLGFTYGVLDDNGGATFKSTLTRAMTNQSALIQLVTWNDFGEGTVLEPTVEFGYRDLAVLQDFRRQYLQPGYSGTTNDLTLPLRLYNLRRQFASNSNITAELNRVFTNLVTGELAAARLQLSGLEAGRPVIYKLSTTNAMLRFLVGGYLSANGTEVQTTSNLASAWQTVSTLNPGLDPLEFTSAIATQVPTSFYQLRTIVP